AAGAQEGTEKWNDVLTAMSAGRRSPAGDALLLRSMAIAAGPRAVAAYRRYADLSAKRAMSRKITVGNGGDSSPELLAKSEAEARLELYAAIRSALPNAAILLPEAASAASIQGALRPGEIVLANMVVGDRVAIITITHDSPPTVTWSTIAYHDIVEPLHGVEARFDELLSPDEEALRFLYTALVAPVQAQLGKSGRIIWSPDPAFARLPVAALRASSPFAVPDEPATDFLGLAHSITFVPSLSAMVSERSAPPTDSPLSVAIGDIDFKQPGFPKLPETVLARRTMDRFVALTGGTALTGDRANLKSLQDLGDRPIKLLMFYTHGVGAQEPEGPALFLMPSGPSPSTVVKPAEIMALRVRPRFVLLAACSTGASARAGAPPFGGVVRSFLVLGSRAVLASQGRVDEAATAELTSAIVEDMVHGNASPAEALRHAQRRLYGTSPNPALWAQLVWVGDGD
ncbi:MAG: hypothetical protein JWO25_3314, partial [Alphaproteobacteria bacterium]|nr:hypothetical protein [Alphaproteobacteria bacterium]